MLRKCEPNDLPQILDLWNTVFGEDENFTKWYFANIFKPENTIAIFEDEKLISMLQMLPYEINGFGKVSYIFGACTYPEFRGKGLMAELIAFSEKLDREAGVKASILIPQEQSLFNFYKRFGYEPDFKIKHKEYFKQNKKGHPYTFFEIESKDVPLLNQAYEDSLKDTYYVVREVDYWDKQIDMFGTLGGKVFGLKDNDTLIAYAFVWNDDDLVAQELWGIDNNAKEIIVDEILEYYNVNKLTGVSLIGTEMQEHDLGSIKFYNTAITDKQYLMNLMFN